MRNTDLNKIWRQAGRNKLICPQEATAHILALEIASPRPELLIHCDVRFLFTDELGRNFNDRAIRLLETAEKAGRKIVPFDWLDSHQKRAQRLLERKPSWPTQMAQSFLSDVAARATGKAPEAELAITTKPFGTDKAHVTVAVNPQTLRKVY